MRDLIRSEWRRFRRLALVVALFHGLALVLLSRMDDVQQLGYQDQGAMLLVYMLLGLTLAVLQVGSYRQNSRWLWLIHRPLAPARIFGALAVSALAQVGVAVFAPLFIFLAATDAITNQVVDVRHYVSLFHALAFAMMAWMAGAHACTSRSKAAVAVLLAPLILALHMASVWWLLLPVLVCLSWLVFIARHSFRADRNAPLVRNSVLLLTALPLQLGFFILVFQLSKASIGLADLLTRSQGRTVLAYDTDVDVEGMIRKMTQDFIAKGLERSRDARTSTWVEQLPLVKVAGISADIDRFPVRHQFGNLSQSWWDDTRNIKWTFSHDRMQFSGRNPTTGASHGWWGVRGFRSTQPFADVPRFGITRSAIYTIDNESQRQHELVRLPEGEWFVSKPVNELDRLILLTNQRLLVYSPDREAASRFTAPKFDWQVRFADGENAPAGVAIAELLDGWLVSMYYYDGREFDGFKFLIKPWQQVTYVDADGNANVVGERRNIRGHHLSTVGSVAVPVASWWVSPPLYALAHLPDLLNTGVTHAPRFEPIPDVPVFYVLALGLMIVSVAAGYFWLRNTQIGSSRRRLWLVICGLLGIPGFLSLICLEPRRNRN